MTEREALKLALEALENVYGKGKRCKAAIAAIKEVLAQPEQEPVGTVKELFTQAAWEKHDLRGSTKVYTTPPQPEQSQVEETLRYEIDALEAKLAECRAQQQEPVCYKHGDEPKRGCAWCDKQPAQQEPVQTIPSFTQLQQIIKNLEHCLSRDSKQEFLRVWIRDWTEHKLSQNTPPPQPEPVIDKSAAVRIATALGWEPKRKPLTEKEIDQITEQLDETTIGWSTHEFARAIEAAHDIKE